MNRQLAAYKAAALPIELRQLEENDYLFTFDNDIITQLLYYVKGKLPKNLAEKELQK